MICDDFAMMHPALAPQTTAVSTPLSILVGQLFSDESRSASAPHLYKIPDITNPNRNLLGGSTGLRHLHPLQLTSAVLGIATATEEFSSMMATKTILRRAKSFLSINLGRRLRPRTSSTLASTLLCGTGVTCTDFGGEGTGRKSYFPLLTFSPRSEPSSTWRSIQNPHPVVENRKPSWESLVSLRLVLVRRAVDGGPHNAKSRCLVWPFVGLHRRGLTVHR